MQGNYGEITLSSLHAHDPSTLKAAQRAQEPPTEARFDQDLRLFQHYHLAAEVIKRLGEPVSLPWKRENTKLHFLGNLHYWSQPPFLARFFLFEEDGILHGRALGLEKEQLLELLARIEPIQQRTDVIARYEQEFAAWHPPEDLG